MHRSQYALVPVAEAGAMLRSLYQPGGAGLPHLTVGETKNQASRPPRSGGGEGRC